MRRYFLRRARARVVASLVARVAMTAMTLARADHDHQRDDRRTSTEGWQTGTATWYGGSGGPGPDGMSIYTGSCAFFASVSSHPSRTRETRRARRGAARRGAAPQKQSIVLTKDDAGGYGSNLPSHYVAAINTDGGYDYGLTTQCGECWEILCVDGRQRGLSDSILGPWAGCVDPAKKSVTVMITDSCPCDHPGNPESNKRWCCGGEGGNRHWDLSYAAFDAIAIRHRGVVDVRYRRTSCDSMGEERYYE
tara:strand:+ start:10996 stop:11745 length:750 start_codon:yes stop_codon:yes gene_type:complete